VPIVGADSGTGLAVMSAVLPGIRGLDVEVASVAAPAWNATWLSSGQLPSAVRITLIDSAGVPTGAPIVARVGLEAAR
jgi:hypothetical protein